MKKKLLSVLLCLCLILTLVPVTARAAELDEADNPSGLAESKEMMENPNDGIALQAENATSGTCGKFGENLTWKLERNDNGEDIWSKTYKLVISGTGPMYDYDHDDYRDHLAPWRQNKDEITEVDIEEGVASIGSAAFQSCSKLIKVTIPDSVTSIGDYAFQKCSKLVEVNIPDNVASIGDYAFHYCYELAKVNIPDGVARIGNYTFYCCEALTHVTIPDSVTSIGGRAFSGSGLISVAIPDSVTSIGGFAFSGCELTTITIPGSVTNIGTDTFYTCNRLTDVIISEGVEFLSEDMFSGCNYLKNIFIPVSVTNIKDSAFSDCYGLKTIAYAGDKTQWGEIEISSGNERLKYADFVFNSSLNSSDADKYLKHVIKNGNVIITDCDSRAVDIKIPETIEGLPVASIEDWAFSGCSGLQNVSIPGSIISIGNWAFAGCSGLTDIAIPESVTSIGNWAFSGCSGLKGVSILSSIASISDWTFAGCSSLTDVSIPESVTSISKSAFAGCSNLNSMIIPNSIKSIGYEAFYLCDSLEDIYYNGTAAQWNDIAINEGNDLLKNAYIHYNSKGPESNLAISVSGFLEDTDAVSVGASTGTVTVKIPETIPNAQAPIQNVLCAFSDSNDASGPASEYKTGSVAEQGQTVQITPNDKNYRTVKIFTLDKDYRPVCKPTVITISSN